MAREEFLKVTPLVEKITWRSKLSTLESTYNYYALFFRLEMSTKPSGCIIEKESVGGHWFFKKKNSTGRFVAQWLDSGDDSGKYPSFKGITKASFCNSALDDLDLWVEPPMAYGEKPDAHPDNSLVVAVYTANFIQGFYHA
ncbi:Transferase [Penicillium odoratum]|uniref:Transferase n=1 Tax=Penicillium odoratum TaxID=1167516 RepID=UPI0025465EC1|nr:Transferase [Penicillium odoratum]KAJ5759290.1 Transferase [Penicillium odoratum]